jgi:hypothetical protein
MSTCILHSIAELDRAPTASFRARSAAKLFRSRALSNPTLMRRAGEPQLGQDKGAMRG